MGKCHLDVILILLGGNLTAQVKKSDGIRLIAVGYTWRRLAATCANSYAINRLGDYFAPIQLGVGVNGGCKSAEYATRRFMESLPNEFGLAKFDFMNAFNNLRRDAMLKAVYKTVPEIYKFCHLSYSQPTKLRYLIRIKIIFVRERHTTRRFSQPTIVLHYHTASFTYAS